MELGLEFMAVVGPDLPDPEWELFDNVIDKVDGVSLSVTLVDFQSPYAGSVINGRILKAANLLASITYECQELDIHLDVMARNLFVVPFGVDLAHAGTAGKLVETVAFEYSIDPCIR